VEQTLEAVIQVAERHTGKTLPRSFGFRWLHQTESIRDGIAEAIVNKVFVDEDHISPCVDIGVGEPLEDGTPIIVANMAGYSPRPFQKNWTGRDGPFVFIIGQPFLSKLAGAKIEPDKNFAFLTPDMKNLR
jgi:hypothetical protein